MQDSLQKCLSCKILQDSFFKNGYLARSCKKYYFEDLERRRGILQYNQMQSSRVMYKLDPKHFEPPNGGQCL